MKAADFRTLMLAQAGVSALVGARVYPVRVPDEVWDSPSERPCVAYRTSGVDRGQTFCATDTLKAERVEVDCYARTYDGARDLATAISQMVDFRGQVGETLFGPVLLDSEVDLMDLEPGLFRRLLIFTVWNRSA